MSTRPPSQTAAAMMCRMSAIIASWWSRSAPEWPCVPIGTSAASARIATKKRRRPRADGEGQHREGGAGDRRDEPGAADLGLDEEAPELRAELGPGV